MEYSSLILWLVSGVALLIAEAAITGVGLIFAGCGALTVGLLLNFGVISIDNLLLQFVVFFATTALWAVLLWRPVQKLKNGKNKTSYHNIIGQIVEVTHAALSKDDDGEVLWSGTIMRARLASGASVERVEVGAKMLVQDIVGNLLIVVPKN